MAISSSSPDHKTLHRLAKAAYRCASDGASIEAVLRSDTKRAEFDFFFLALADYFGLTIAPEDGHRILLGLRNASLSRSSGAAPL